MVVFNIVGCSHHSTSMIRQLNYLNDLLIKIEDENQCERIIGKLDDLKSTLTSPHNITVHMAANLDKLTKPEEPWIQKFLPQNSTPEKDP